MATIGTLNVNVAANTSKLRKGLSSARTQVGAFSSAISKVGPIAVTAFAAIGAAAAAGFAVVVRSQLEAIDLLAKTADSLGINIEALSGLEHAASITGASQQELTNALQRMLKTVSDANQGLSTAKRALSQLGLSAKDLEKLRPEQQFARIADAMGGVANQTDKARIAQDVFGRGGRKLINTLALGSEGLREMTEEAKSLGLTISREEAAKIEKFNDAMTKFKAVLTGVARTIVISIVPAMTKFLSLFVDVSTIGAAAKKSSKEIQAIADAQRKVTEETKAATDAAKKLKKENTEIANRAKSVFDQTRTPIEKFRSRVEDVRKLAQVGAISWDTYGRAVKQAFVDVVGMGKAVKKQNLTVGAVVKGSREAFSAERIKPTVAEREITKLTKKQIKIQEDANRILKDIEAGVTTDATQIANIL